MPNANEETWVLVHRFGGALEPQPRATHAYIKDANISEANQELLTSRGAVNQAPPPIPDTFRNLAHGPRQLRSPRTPLWWHLPSFLEKFTFSIPQKPLTSQPQCL